MKKAFIVMIASVIIGTLADNLLGNPICGGDWKTQLDALVFAIGLSACTFFAGHLSGACGE